MNHEMVPRTRSQTQELETIYYADSDVAAHNDVVAYEAPVVAEVPAVREEAASSELAVAQPEERLPAVISERTAQNDNEKITLVVGGLAEGVEQNAIRETAQREFDHSMAQGGGWLRRFVRGAVKGNYLRELTLLRERRHAANDIAETGRLSGMTDDQWNHVTAESIQRVLDDDGSRELIDEQAGESREVLDDERGGEIKSLINNMITDYVNGEISREAIQEETRRRLAELARGNPDAAELMGAGNVYMTNIADIAETVRGQMSHERGLQEVLDRIEVVSAKLHTDVHGEARATKFEQVLEKIPVNAAWVSTALAVGYGLGVGFGKSVLNKATRFGLVSVGSGAMSYFQEKARLTHERAQVGREAAISENVDGTERRQRLAETLYDMKDASVMSEAMRSLQNDEGKYELGDQTSFDALLTATLDASARMDVSATTRADHIRFSSRENIPAERRALMTERFRARAALRQYYEAQIANDPNFAGGQDFETFFTQSSATMQEGLLSNQSEQDSSYKKLSNRLALRSALRGMVFGAVIGEFIQETTALPNTEVRGAFENSHESTDTLLSAGWRLVAGQFEQHAPSHDIGSTITSGHNQLDLGRDLSYHDGTLSGPDGLKVDGLSMGDHGFDEASVAKLHAAGVDYNDTVSHVAHTTEVTHTADTQTYMQQHGQPVERTWDDNNTPNVSDGNELRADFKVDDQGNYVVSASRMVQGDSFHDGKVADINFSHMKVLLSPTVETQATPLVLDMDAHGNVIIPKGSAAEQWFAKGSDGAPSFHGAYVEIAESNGNGNYEVLATAVGTGDAIPTVTEQVQQTTSVEAHHMSLFYAPKPETLDVELPPVISIDSREGLRKSDNAGRSPETPPVPPSAPERSPLAIEQRPTAGGVLERRPTTSTELERWVPERHTQTEERQELRRALQSSYGRESRPRTLQKSIEASPRASMLALTSREWRPPEASPRRGAEQSEAKARPAAAERQVAEPEGLTPHQLVEQHPEYAEAIAKAAAARRTGGDLYKIARRQQTKVYRRLLGYYERLADERRGAERQLDPNEEGINIHEQAARDPRYVEMRRSTDRMFKQEHDLLRGRPERELNASDRARLVRLREMRRKAEGSLDRLKAAILNELDRSAGGHEGSA